MLAGGRSSLLFERSLLEVFGHLCGLLLGLAVGLGGRAVFRVEAGDFFLGFVDVLQGLV